MIHGPSNSTAGVGTQCACLFSLDLFCGAEPQRFCQPFAETIANLTADFTDETITADLYGGNAVNLPLGCGAAGLQGAVVVLQPADTDRAIRATTCLDQEDVFTRTVINAFPLDGKQSCAGTYQT